MRITLNLASRPYVELRPVFARLRLIAGILCLLALVLWLSLRTLERKAAVADTNVSHWTNLTNGLQREWLQDRAMMQQPQNAATLERSDYLNNLFASKAFSWTAALMDLENVLPAGVQVISLAPQMAKDGRVLVHLHVSGERDKAVDLIRNLERSQHFLNPQLVGESAEQPESNGRPGFVPQPSIATDVNFDILAEYNPQRMEDMPAADKKEKSATQTPGATSGNAISHPTKRGAR